MGRFWNCGRTYFALLVDRFIAYTNKIGSSATRTFGTQTPGEAPKKDQATQCGIAKGSYARDESNLDRKWRYDDLIGRLHDKDRLIQWLMEDGLLGKSRVFSICGDDMKLVNCDDRSVAKLMRLGVNHTQ